jgi:dihydrofolate reductase
MSKVTVFTNLTLDGVMQAPGRPDEDTRDSFTHGGWAAPYAAMQDARDAVSFQGALLFGRRTYEDFYSFWPHQTNNPFTEILNKVQKYVASTTLEEPLPWSNSTLLKGDATKALSKLKAEQDKDLLIFGSGVLVQSLIGANLIDEYVFLIHLLILGSGRRLFPEAGAFATLNLRDTKTTSKGVVIATFEPANKSQEIPGE